MPDSLYHSTVIRLRSNLIPILEKAVNIRRVRTTSDFALVGIYCWDLSSAAGKCKYSKIYIYRLSTNSPFIRRLLNDFQWPRSYIALWVLGGPDARVTRDRDCGRFGGPPLPFSYNQVGH